MKVNVQIVDIKNGCTQYGQIDEPVQKGFEIANALAHFGVNINTIEWHYEHSNAFIAKCGEIKGTSKVVSVIADKVVSDQPQPIGDYSARSQQV